MTFRWILEACPELHLYCCDSSLSFWGFIFNWQRNYHIQALTPPLYKPPRNTAATGGTEPIAISDLARAIDIWPVFLGILAARSGPQRRAPSKKQVIRLFHPSFVLPGLI